MRGLQVIYSFFLGLAVATFVGIGMATFYPRPKADYGHLPETKGLEESAEYQAKMDAHAELLDTWSLNTSIVLLVIATAIVVAALFLGDRLIVLSNGLLLGGLFTFVYAVGNSFTNSQNVLRFSVITVALVVTVAVGWLKFRQGPTVSSATAAAAPRVGDDGVTASLEHRISDLERRLDALRKALDT